MPWLALLSHGSLPGLGMAVPAGNEKVSFFILTLSLCLHLGVLLSVVIAEAPP